MSIEGNIGCGKTTILENLGEALVGNNDSYSLKGLLEPVEKWRSYNGMNLLDRMYQEPREYGLRFQMLAHNTFLSNHRDAYASDADVVVMERSVHSAPMVFIPNMHYGYSNSNIIYSLKQINRHII